MRYRDKTTGEILTYRQAQNRKNMSFPENSPPDDMEIYTPEPQEPSLEDVLYRQRMQIKEAAEAAYVEPVTDQQGRTWVGGFDSGLRANMASELSDYTGKPEITLYDADDNEHTLSPGQAKQVAVTIGAAYQQKLAAEKAALRALKAIDLTAPDAKEQIEAVTWAGFYSGA